MIEENDEVGSTVCLLESSINLFYSFIDTLACDSNIIVQYKEENYKYLQPIVITDEILDTILLQKTRKNNMETSSIFEIEKSKNKFFTWKIDFILVRYAECSAYRFSNIAAHCKCEQYFSNLLRRPAKYSHPKQMEKCQYSVLRFTG